MVSAYVLITTKSGAEKIVLDSLKKSKEIVDARIVYGEYDIIAKVRVSDITKLNDFLLEAIRPVSGIEKTSTLIIAN